MHLSPLIFETEMLFKLSAVWRYVAVHLRLILRVLALTDASDLTLRTAADLATRSSILERIYLNMLVFKADSE